MLGSTIFFSKELLRMCLVSAKGMLEYILEMYSEANVWEGWIGVFFRSCITCVRF
jgi:hypothetical protein